MNRNTVMALVAVPVGALALFASWTASFEDAMRFGGFTYLLVYFILTAIPVERKTIKLEQQLAEKEKEIEFRENKESGILQTQQELVKELAEKEKDYAILWEKNGEYCKELSREEEQLTFLRKELTEKDKQIAKLKAKLLEWVKYYDNQIVSVKKTEQTGDKNEP